MNNPTRRDAAKGIIAGLASLVLPSCFSIIVDSNNTNQMYSTTGVAGLNTPDEILQNPYVNNVINRMNEEGAPPRLSRSINPPIISGEYGLEGFRLFPNTGSELTPGIFRWKNQTINNYIDTDYSQEFGGVTTQTGTSSIGEIIRGSGNRFTVYSVLNIRDNLTNCEDVIIFIVDGMQDSNGDVKALYCGTPIEKISCLEQGGGAYELTLLGAAKSINKTENPDSVSLMSSKNF